MSIASDASGYGPHGEIQGAQWVAGGVSGQALDFDGVNDYVSFDAEPEIQDELTVSAWVRPEQAPTGKGRVVIGTYDWDSDSTNRRGWLLGTQYGSTDALRFRVHDDTGSLGIASLNGFFATYLNQWVHVTGVFKPGESVALYVNGEKVAEDTTDVPTAIGLSGKFKIGARADNTTQGHWDGQIDEVRVIGRALSQQEIQSLMVVGARKYYYAAGQRVAMDRNGVVQYLYGDHLGSTSLSTDESGVVVARQWYYPYGEERGSSGTLATEYQFTGQRRERGIGLYDYDARFYDPALGRFISADTIVPEPGNPQDLNRYAYVKNNPLVYIDPSGHAAELYRNSKYLGPPPQPSEGAFQREVNRVIWNTIPSVSGTYMSADLTVKPTFVVGSTSGLEAMYIFNWRSGEFSVAGSVNMGSVDVGTPQFLSGEVTRGYIAGMGYSSNDAFLGPSIDYELSLEADTGVVSKGMVLGTSREVDTVFNPDTGRTEWVTIYDEVSQMQPHTYYFGVTVGGDVNPYPVPLPFDASLSAGVSCTGVMATLQLYPWKWKDEGILQVDVMD